MPHTRVGALKISDHHVRSPMLNINRACQTCHHMPEMDALVDLDFIEAENSTGFHAPQEAARILAESVDESRLGQVILRDPGYKPTRTNLEK